jgi:hypothetical protein
MKTNSLTTIVIVLIMLLSQSNLMAQRQSKEEFHQRKWEFVVAKTEMTSQEVAKVYPIFIEYEQAVWEIMQTNFRHMRNMRSDKKPNFEALNERYVNAEIQKAHLMKVYYSKLKNELSAEKIFNLWKADRDFRDQLMRGWKEKDNKARKD